MTTKRKKAEPVPVAAADFSEYVESFKAAYPDEWEKLRLCPLQHGLQDMARLLG